MPRRSPPTAPRWMSGTADLKLGEKVTVLGYPECRRRLIDPHERATTPGTSTTAAAFPFMKTDASLNPGVSGGCRIRLRW